MVEMHDFDGLEDACQRGAIVLVRENGAFGIARGPTREAHDGFVLRPRRNHLTGVILSGSIGSLIRFSTV